MLRILFEQLPPRARSLSRAETSKVFGGCADFYVACQKDTDCCDNRLFACKEYYEPQTGNTGKMCMKPG